MDDTGLARELARLAERMHQAPDPEHTASQVVDYALQQLGADHAGITLIRRGRRLETVAPTDPVVTRADVLQYELGEGPCHDSAWQGETLVSQDLEVDPRWPRWGPKAVAIGIRSALGVELKSKGGDRRLGAVNLYWDHPRVFSSDEIALAHLISRHAALALAASRPGRPARPHQAAPRQPARPGPGDQRVAERRDVDRPVRWLRRGCRRGRTPGPAARP